MEVVVNQRQICQFQLRSLVVIPQSLYNRVDTTRTFVKKTNMASRNRMMDESLIFAVAQYPLIYTKTHPCYHLFPRRLQAFRAISQQTGMDGK